MKSGTTKAGADAASFRDNRGFVYWADGQVFRQINMSGQASYDRLMSSGLYNSLTRAGLLIPHREITPHQASAYKAIRPEPLAFISYPYEWSFSQLKDAALATIKIQKSALEHGLTLRDASAYNIQFIQGTPHLIDTLSFEPYEVGRPWQAYRQFCQHFLAPLALVSYVDPGLQQLLKIHIDGIPLPLATKLLPARSAIHTGIAVHLKLHARLQRSHEGSTNTPQRRISMSSLSGVIDSLERTVRALKPPIGRTQWSNYYNETNYSQAAFEAKKAIVSQYIKRTKPARVLDLGANNGVFSRLAGAEPLTISTDMDPLAVEQNYLESKSRGETNLLPLVIDLTNPSPAIGWANRERQSFAERAQADLILALALVHHLAIASNIPLGLIADLFKDLAPNLIIEFVPKSDSQVKRLLATREDIFDDYTQTGFEAAFGQSFEITSRHVVKDSDRIIYLMKRKK